MENKKQIGGKRKGAGRKPVLSKKEQISLYVEGVKIIKFGSEEKLKETIYKFIDEFGKDVELNSTVKFIETTPAAYDGKKNDSIKYDEPALYAEPKSSITGLTPKLSFFSDFMSELDNCKTYDAVQLVMNKAKGEAFLPKDRIALENKAKQVVSEKGLYND